MTIGLLVILGVFLVLYMMKRRSRLSKQDFD
jgi:Tfp pilus assembly protein PilW